MYFLAHVREDGVSYEYYIITAFSQTCLIFNTTLRPTTCRPIFQFLAKFNDQRRSSRF